MIQLQIEMPDITLPALSPLETLIFLMVGSMALSLFLGICLMMGGKIARAAIMAGFKRQDMLHVYREDGVFEPIVTKSAPLIKTKKGHFINKKTSVYHSGGHIVRPTHGSYARQIRPQEPLYWQAILNRMGFKDLIELRQYLNRDDIAATLGLEKVPIGNDGSIIDVKIGMEQDPGSTGDNPGHGNSTNQMLESEVIMDYKDEDQEKIKRELVHRLKKLKEPLIGETIDYNMVMGYQSHAMSPGSLAAYIEYEALKIMDKLQKSELMKLVGIGMMVLFSCVGVAILLKFLGVF